MACDGISLTIMRWLWHLAFWAVLHLFQVDFSHALRGVRKTYFVWVWKKPSRSKQKKNCQHRPFNPHNHILLSTSVLPHSSILCSSSCKIVFLGPLIGERWVAFFSIGLLKVTGGHILQLKTQHIADYCSLCAETAIAGTHLHNAIKIRPVAWLTAGCAYLEAESSVPAPFSAQSSTWCWRIGFGRGGCL